MIDYHRRGRKSTGKESKAHAEWMKNNTHTISIRLHNTKDRDIIEYLAKQESRQGYIKMLIRKAIAQDAANIQQ